MEEVKPIIKESLREQFGVHTCDRRSSLSAIRRLFPQYEIEKGFTENDELWTSEQRESVEEVTLRLKGFLQQLFQDDDSTYVSVTTHSGAIRALEAALGHPDVWPGVGSMIPFMVQSINKTSESNNSV